MTHITVIKFDDNLLKQFGNVQQYVQQSFLQKASRWIFDPGYRKAVEREAWLEAQVKNPDPAVRKFIAAHTALGAAETNDDKAMTAFLVVTGALTYKTDKQRWNASDYWSTAAETLTATTEWNGIKYGPMEGDCEDGSSLIYVVARILGVPKEQLAIWLGDVAAGGHAVCIYRPTNYILNWVFLDWCYYPNTSRFGNRPLYEIKGNYTLGEQFIGDMQTGNLDFTYGKMWYAFNEDTSYLTFDYNLQPPYVPSNNN